MRKKVDKNTINENVSNCRGECDGLWHGTTTSESTTCTAVLKLCQFRTSNNKTWLYLSSIMCAPFMCYMFIPSGPGSKYWSNFNQHNIELAPFISFFGPTESGTGPVRPTLVTSITFTNAINVFKIGLTNQSYLYCCCFYGGGISFCFSIL